MSKEPAADGSMFSGDDVSAAIKAPAQKLAKISFDVELGKKLILVSPEEKDAALKLCGAEFVASIPRAHQIYSKNIAPLIAGHKKKFLTVISSLGGPAALALTWGTRLYDVVQAEGEKTPISKVVLPLSFLVGAIALLAFIGYSLHSAYRQEGITEKDFIVGIFGKSCQIPVGNRAGIDASKA